MTYHSISEIWILPICQVQEFSVDIRLVSLLGSTVALFVLPDVDKTDNTEHDEDECWTDEHCEFDFLVRWILKSQCQHDSIPMKKGFNVHSL